MEVAEGDHENWGSAERRIGAEITPTVPLQRGNKAP